jgi:hypothetical protein
MGLVASVAQGAVLCRKRSGAIFVRDACRKREQVFNTATLGVTGPSGVAGAKGDPGVPGEARAYGCSNVSLDGSLAVACTERPAKNVLQVLPADNYATCFVLDPSIDASSAIVLVSWNDHTATTAGPNVVLSVFAAKEVFGCPPNSVKIVTARATTVAGGGLTQQGFRVAVNVAVM